jgi:hypothetical protein
MPITKLSGVNFYNPTRVHLWREETRAWYLRLRKDTAGGPVLAYAYDNSTNAANGTSDYAASGTAAAASDVSMVMSNNAPVPPTFAGATLDLTMSALDQTGVAIYKVDLGTKLQRGVLRVFRALSKISTTNGYFFTPGLVELGVKQWEEVEPGEFPYIGVYAGLVQSEPFEISDGGMETTQTIGGVAHILNLVGGERSYADAWNMYHDIRRAIAVQAREVYDGPVNDGLIFEAPIVSSAEPDKGIVWARERATVNFTVTVTVHETGAEIEAA